MGPKMAVIQVAKIEGTKLLYVKWQLAFNISYFMWVGGFYYSAPSSDLFKVLIS